MKTLKFTKMHGCGNDYIYFNCFTQQIDDPHSLAIKLSDRHTGVGGDGIILVCPSKVADCRMRMFNADGSEGRMCGNGIRCVGKFAYDAGLVDKEVITVETLAGIKTLYFTIENGKVSFVRVDMGRASFAPDELPARFEGEKAIAYKTKIAGGEYKINAVSMGNPHCVLFTHENFGEDFDLDSFDIEKQGPSFENDPFFPDRVNTEFAELVDSHTVKMRVWERGSGETWACGTGACATAVAAVENEFCPKGEDITVILRGGRLVINYTDEAVFMTGPAEAVFDGELTVD